MLCLLTSTFCRHNDTQQQQQQDLAPLLLQPLSGPPLCPRHRQLQLAVAGRWGQQLDRTSQQQQQQGAGSSSSGSSSSSSSTAQLPPGAVALLGGLVGPGNTAVDVGVGEGSAALLVAGKVRRGEGGGRERA